MSASHVPNEVWIAIMEQLLQPIPLPLSKPARSALRQPDICSMMRVCKKFPPLAEPLLYRHVVTDCLPLLFRDITPEEISLNTPLYLAKRRQFAFTKSLTIEYGEKGEDPSQTYTMLFNAVPAPGQVKFDRWGCIGLSVLHRKYRRLGQCNRELQSLNKCLEEISKTSMPAVLPILRSVRVASIYGFEPDTWRQLEREYANRRDSDGNPVPTMPPMTWLSSGNFQKFLATGNLRSICVRDCHGPLAIPEGHNMFCDNFAQHTTIHFSADIARLPFPLNYPSRWLLDGPPVYNWDGLIHKLGARFHKVHAGRTQLAPGQALNLILGCSTSRSSSSQFEPRRVLDEPPPPSSANPIMHTLSTKDQRDRAAQLGAVIREALGKNIFTGEDISKDDRLEWQSAADSAPCEACGYSCEV